MAKHLETTEHTKATISEAFWLLYVRHGMDNVSVKDIINKAGYNRSTFYQYFDNKYAVLEYIEDGIIQHFIDALTMVYLNEAKLESSLDIIAELYSSRAEYLSVLLGHNGNPAFFPKVKDKIYPLWMKIIRIANPNETSRLIFEYSVSGVFSAITHWYNNGVTISSKELAGMMRQIAFNGAVSEIAKLENKSFDSQ